MKMVWMRWSLLLGWIVLLAFLYAMLEIQIEGAQGWAAGLPTWRIDNAPHLQWLVGGRPLTGYHTFLFTFMFAVFHAPVFILGKWSWFLEARIMGSLMLFWVMEDALWFVMNPAYGLARLTPADVPWHPHWMWNVPTDYIVYMTGGVLLLACSYWMERNPGKGAA